MHPGQNICAIPLWVNGHAILKLTPAFRDVRNPASGVVLRRVPLCGPAELGEALGAAAAGVSGWQALGEDRRKALLAALGNAVEGLWGHFSRLLAEETGVDEASAERDVLRVVTALCEPVMRAASGVVVASGASKGFADMAELAASVLAAGSTLVACPAQEAPSAFLALAELSGRCGFPDGVVNVVYADAAVLSAAGVTTSG